MAKAPQEIISHWYQPFEGLQASSLDFYRAVEEAMARQQIPDAKIHRVDWREGGLGSAKRVYLRIPHRDHVIDICSAPCGNGFFVSSWLGEQPTGCLGAFADFPGLGTLIRLFIRPATYYKIDTALMFQPAVHTAVLEVVDGMTKAKGLRALSELERKPVLMEFWGRQVVSVRPESRICWTAVAGRGRFAQALVFRRMLRARLGAMPTTHAGRQGRWRLRGAVAGVFAHRRSQQRRLNHDTE